MNLARRARLKAAKWRVWKWLRRMGLPLAILGGVALVSAIASLAYLGFSEALKVNINRQPAPIDVARLALAVAAGFGGLVALVVAYRRQKDLEEGRFIERFGAAAAQLGHTDVAVRMAGVYAMAGVADKARDEQRQQCIDVLCGYLRLPFSPEQGNNHQTQVIYRSSPIQGMAGTEEEKHFHYRQNDREVRQTIVRLVSSHLQPEARPSWSEHDFNFTGAYLETANFNGARFSGENTVFFAATFGGGDTSFAGARFSRGNASFSRATFGGGKTTFAGAIFNCANTSIDRVTFNGHNTSFEKTTFGGGETSFFNTTFRGDNTTFKEALFLGEKTGFEKVSFLGNSTAFDQATFGGQETSFVGVDFGSGTVSFERPRKWAPAPVFGWEGDDPGGSKPENVKPADWPPEASC